MENLTPAFTYFYTEMAQAISLDKSNSITLSNFKKACEQKQRIRDLGELLYVYHRLFVWFLSMRAYYLKSECSWVGSLMTNNDKSSNKLSFWTYSLNNFMTLSHVYIRHYYLIVKSMKSEFTTLIQIQLNRLSLRPETRYLTIPSEKDIKIVSVSQISFEIKKNIA